MNYYHKSDGSRISKAQIDRNVSQTKREIIEDQKNEFGYNFCTQCRLTGHPKNADPMELGILDCAHIKSVNDCQRDGMSEFAWNKSNIEILCRFHHRVIDGLDLRFNKKEFQK